MDEWRQSTPIILKILGVDRLVHGATWPAKDRNVSKLEYHFRASIHPVPFPL